jgi:hypothetical protein
LPPSLIRQCYCRKGQKSLRWREIDLRGDYFHEPIPD